MNQHQQSIAEIYKSKGEAFLIQEEERCLRSHDLRSFVTASSGSVIYTDAKDYVQSRATVLWLDVPPKDTISFLEGDDSSDRILLGGDSMLHNLQERQAHYREWSSYRIAGKKNIEETVEEIRSLECWR
jgi:shikimate kinase